MEQFVAVAVAHFLALLIPGVDFFLIARAAMTSGWRRASGVCLGIALANGVLIAAAFTGLSLISHPMVLAVIQVAGGAFLIYIGVAFIRSTKRFEVADERDTAESSWLRNLGLGILSGLLNPKNALFYLSLAAILTGASTLALVGYGLWMVAVVLAWDLLIAIALGSRRSLVLLERLVPWITRIAGVFLLLFGVALVVGVGSQLVA